MFESLDVLIGFAVVMLTFSLVVTAIIQGWVEFRQLRGKKLREGLAELMHQLGLDPASSEQVAEAVVLHPRLGGGLRLIRNLGPRTLASVVEREELVQMLLGLAAGKEPVALEEKSRKSLAVLIQSLGISDPDAALRSIRVTAMHLEHDRPEIAAHVRQALATVEVAGSQFVANLHSWFDTSMGRVSQIFGAHVRMVTIVVAALLAFTLQLDSIELINRLSIDKELRAKLVEEGAAIASRDSLPGIESLRTEAVSRLVTPQYPLRFDHGVHANLKPLRAWPGILLSAVLLGLGAPFWFNWLKTLLSLRSSLAQKEDEQSRSRSDAAPARAVAGAAPGLAGESGEAGPVG